MKIQRLLLTNDDGFDAPGLAALRDAARLIATEIWVVAPMLDQSGVGQSITINNPLRCVPRGDRQFAVSGTPADCVVMALAHLMQDSPPDAILSGVNAGVNCGDDAHLSGTLGAAFMGALLGIPSIGISQGYARRQDIKWDTARHVLPELLTGLLDEPWDRKSCLSVNIPDAATAQIKGVRRTRPTPGNLRSFKIEPRTDLRDRDYFWIYPHHAGPEFSPKDSEQTALAQREISVSKLTLDRGALGDV